MAAGAAPAPARSPSISTGSRPASPPCRTSAQRPSGLVTSPDGAAVGWERLAERAARNGPGRRRQHDGWRRPPLLRPAGSRSPTAHLCGRRRRAASRPQGRPARSPASASRSRTWSRSPGVPVGPGRPAASRPRRSGTTPRWWPVFSSAGPGWSAPPGSTSSASGSPASTASRGRRRTPPIRASSPAVPARDRPRRWPSVSPMWPSAPTPGGRAASPPPCAASSATRPAAAWAPPACFRSPPRSIIWAGARRRWRWPGRRPRRPVCSTSRPVAPTGRIGVLGAALGDSRADVAAAVSGALDALRADGFTVTELDWPHAPLVHAVTTTIMFAEAARVHLASLDAHPEAYGDDVRGPTGAGPLGQRHGLPGRPQPARPPRRRLRPTRRRARRGGVSDHRASPGQGWRRPRARTSPLPSSVTPASTT